MSVLSSRALHEQLAGILAALSKAALAEMCAAVDQGFSALQNEISRRQKENEDLRKKLHLIESIVLKGSSGVEAVVEEETVKHNKLPPTQEREQREKRPEAVVEQPEPVETPEQLPDVVLIKDEDSDTNDIFEEDEKLCVENRESQSPQPKTLNSGPRRSSSSETNTGLNPNEQRSGPVYSLDSPQGEMVCSYSSQVDTDTPFVKLECAALPPVCPVENGPQFFNCDSQSPGQSAELDPWTKPPHQSMYETYTEHSEVFGLKLLGITGSVNGCNYSENSRSSGFDFDDSTHMSGFGLYRTDQSGGREQSNGYKARRFLCSTCNKTYATAQGLEVHMRIHTGERPFRCDHCGKRFTQSAHLKGHMSVHTEAKPFSCSFCSRGFVLLNTLKLHMNKCHPDTKHNNNVC